MSVSQWMQVTVRTVEPERDLLRAWRMMMVYKIRHLPVVTSDGKLAGILSDRDIKQHALPPEVPGSLLARQEHLEAIKVGAIMVRDVVTVAPGASMAFAAHLMRHHRIDCLPVLDEGRLVGIVTSSDLLDYFPRSLGSEPGGSLVSVTIPADYGALHDALGRIRGVRSHPPTLLLRPGRSEGQIELTFAVAPRQTEQARLAMGASAVLEALP